MSETPDLLDRSHSPPGWAFHSAGRSWRWQNSEPVELPNSEAWDAYEREHDPPGLQVFDDEDGWWRYCIESVGRSNAAPCNDEIAARAAAWAYYWPRADAARVLRGRLRVDPWPDILGWGDGKLREHVDEQGRPVAIGPAHATPPPDPEGLARDWRREGPPGLRNLIPDPVLDRARAALVGALVTGLHDRFLRFKLPLPAKETELRLVFARILEDAAVVEALATLRGEAPPTATSAPAPASALKTSRERLTSRLWLVRYGLVPLAETASWTDAELDEAGKIVADFLEDETGEAGDVTDQRTRRELQVDLARLARERNELAVNLCGLLGLNPENTVDAQIEQHVEIAVNGRKALRQILGIVGEGSLHTCEDDADPVVSRVRHEVTNLRCSLSVGPAPALVLTGPSAGGYMPDDIHAGRVSCSFEVEGEGGAPMTVELKFAVLKSEIADDGPLVLRLEPAGDALRPVAEADGWVHVDPYRDAAEALWKLLDDIDTADDQIKPLNNPDIAHTGLRRFRERVMELVERRHRYLTSDGHTLVLARGVGTIATAGEFVRAVEKIGSEIEAQIVNLDNLNQPTEGLCFTRVDWTRGTDGVLRAAFDAQGAVLRFLSMDVLESGVRYLCSEMPHRRSSVELVALLPMQTIPTFDWAYVAPHWINGTQFEVFAKVTVRFEEPDAGT